jgi:hypothetical protein
MQQMDDENALAKNKKDAGERRLFVRKFYLV